MGNKARAGQPTQLTGHLIRDSSLGLVPETIEQIIELNDSLWHRSGLSPALLEVIRMRNARTVNCVYCRSVRYDVAKQAGLTEERLEHVADGYEKSERLSEDEKLVLALADVYLRDPGNFPPALIARLRERFGAPQVMQFAVALATYNATSRCAVSLGGMPESLPVTEIALPPVRSASAS